MIVPSIVLLTATVVLLIGAGVELRQSLRSRSPGPATTAENGAVTGREFDIRTCFLWVGVAAAAVLAPGMLETTSLTASELGLGVYVLGLAAERGQYLARFASDGRGPALSAFATGATVLGGLAYGAG